MAAIRVGSGGRGVPIATRLGTGDQHVPIVWKMRELTLVLAFVFEQDNTSLAECDGAEAGSDRRLSRSQILFRLVNVIDTPSTTTDVLRIDRADSVPPCPDTEDERVLPCQLDRAVCTGQQDNSPSL